MNSNRTRHNVAPQRTMGSGLDDELSDRFLGIDIGAETLKVVELVRMGSHLQVNRRHRIEHGKKPGHVLREVLAAWDWPSVRSAAVCGRLGRLVNLPRIPIKQAQVRGFRVWFPKQPATVISMGSHGFSVLELRPNGLEILRENSRCSQGTGNFLRQLVERFDLTIDEADRMCAGIENPAALSGRCPVILKTDMTHLANKGEDRARILAGLFDAVCENVLALLKPGISPEQVFLCGGVSQGRRIQQVFQQRLAQQGMSFNAIAGDDGLFLEALGCAVLAAEQSAPVPSLDQLMASEARVTLDTVPPLADALPRVHRMPPAAPTTINGQLRELLLGFDIGSTGSKAVAIDAHSREMVWEGYLQTRGNPVGAAQELVRRFLAGPAAGWPVRGLGVTGSGREIVGSLMTTCYGKESVYVLNEIAAHAAGATHFEPLVDTIFEIGGQDAKYIRLAGGKVIDCAMNEACSAGTGSFIEEQGRKFSGIRDVVHLGQEALAAPEGVSLGQHCSVFMAEIIDEAVAAGVGQRSIIAGLYDSIVQNYLHRVKGSRSVGQVIFCQGMPFASDALAAAVARHTGSRVVVPPNPGTVGALGIGLLAQRELTWQGRAGLALDRFLAAAVESKETFICGSTRGCGGTGNHCRIDCLHTRVDGQPQKFTWGGSCSLHDKGTRKNKLPDLAPDPFQQRAALVREITGPLTARRGRPCVAMTDEFVLKGLLPFFATFIHQLGFDLEIASNGNQALLKRGIQEASVPFCAPMQLYYGVMSRLAESQPDFLLLPMLRELPRVDGEARAVVCPIVQASADLLRGHLRGASTKLISPVINLGPGNWSSPEFRASCRQLSRDLGFVDGEWIPAHAAAVKAQADFEARCSELGRQALAFCAARGVVPVVVLGRHYTIHNPVLNSNVPAILRDQGAVAIPLDCYPIEGGAPVFESMYWGSAQRILRAAHRVRRSAGHYAIYCSNYSCGPDGFNLHFFSHLMEGKPFAVIETDGHSGDAGTKTRVEAFLHCVEQDRQGARCPAVPQDFDRIGSEIISLREVPQRGERVLIPWMGPASLVPAACLRGAGIPAETLPMPDAESVRLGRRYTSGKECLPMGLTLGSLLQRLQQAQASERFVYLMPRTFGPCRLGMYRLLDQMVLERNGGQERVRVWSPAETGYFADLPPVVAMLVFAGFTASDVLLEACLETRPGELRPGAAQEIFQRRHTELLALLERIAGEACSTPAALWQVASGRMFGVTRLLKQAAAEFALVHRHVSRPTVSVVGEIYVRCDPFANGFVVEKLLQRGLRVRFATMSEWLEYSDHLNASLGSVWDLSQRLSRGVQAAIRRTAWAAMARLPGWPAPAPVTEILAASASYLREDLWGEALMTVGNPLRAWRRGEIDGALSVGPLECLPNKISEAHFAQIAEREGLPSLTLSLNGDPVDDEVLDNFAFEVRSRFQKRQAPSPDRGCVRSTNRSNLPSQDVMSSSHA